MLFAKLTLLQEMRKHQKQPTQLGRNLGAAVIYKSRTPECPVRSTLRSMCFSVALSPPLTPRVSP